MQERPSFLPLQITSLRTGGPVGPGSIHGERTPAFISHPKLLISLSGGSSDQLPSTMSSADGQVGAIRRKIAKPGLDLRLCVQVIHRPYHG